MTTPAPGTPKAKCPTPIVCVDSDALDHNISAIAATVAAGKKVWRPQASTHGCSEIVQRQMNAGAFGVTCVSLATAEKMAAVGVREILLANLYVGEGNVERLVRLCAKTDLIVSVDHFAQAQPLALACEQQGVTCRILIVVDVGGKRFGMRPGRDTVELAKGIHSLNGIRLAGIIGFEGFLSRVADPVKKRLEIFDALDLLKHTRDLMQNEELPCDIVSAGATGTFQTTSEHSAVTEIYAGGGVFGDSYRPEHSNVEGLLPTMTVSSTVISRPALDRAVLDCGYKSLATHREQLPQLKDAPGATVKRFDADHTVLHLRGAARDLTIGCKVELVVPVAELTVMLHDRLWVFQNEALVESWAREG